MAIAKPASKSDKKADAKSDGKDKKKGGQDAIMPVADMRAVLAIARQGGNATVAFAQDTDHEGVILMDRRIRPKKLLKELKDKAGKASMRLDAGAMRFGRIQIGGSGHVTFVVNRDTSPNMRPKLLEHLKQIGYSHLQIMVDLSLEDEPEDEVGGEEGEAQGGQPAGGPADGQASQPAGPSAAQPAAEGGAQPAAAGAAQPAAGGAAQPAAAGATQSAAGGTQPAGGAAQPAAAGAAQPAAGAAQPAAAGGASQPTAPADPRVAAEITALTNTLNQLAQQMRLAITANPVQERFLKPVALKAAQALKAGDVRTARESIASLTELVGKQGAAPSSGAAAANGGAASRGEPASQKTIANARVAWIATRQKIETDLDKLHTAFASAFKGHHMENDLTAVFRQRVDSVLDTLDDNLAHTLNDLNNASDPANRAKLVDNAHDLIAGYMRHIDQDDTIKELDQNPFVKLSIRQTIETTLGTLSRAIR
ncbi:MAG TPA: hypothetical protein VHB27_18315 [Rhodopila sp.]|uniref:hypothetical protein n=1 Tax=Rhodopila sp. TaxID=2480087 RepID=UPI002BD2359E|nr:hypothetical protein [Rhodopila sp.]HVY17184.1 hypothetical protein [Rhodopila sp.]